MAFTFSSSIIWPTNCFPIATVLAFITQPLRPTFFALVTLRFSLLNTIVSHAVIVLSFHLPTVIPATLHHFNACARPGAVGKPYKNSAFRISFKHNKPLHSTAFFTPLKYVCAHRRVIYAALCRRIEHTLQHNHAHATAGAAFLRPAQSLAHHVTAAGRRAPPLLHASAANSTSSFPVFYAAAAAADSHAALIKFDALHGHNLVPNTTVATVKTRPIQQQHRVLHAARHGIHDAPTTPLNTISVAFPTLTAAAPILATVRRAGFVKHDIRPAALAVHHDNPTLSKEPRRLSQARAGRYAAESQRSRRAIASRRDRTRAPPRLPLPLRTVSGRRRRRRATGTERIILFCNDYVACYTQPFLLRRHKKRIAFAVAGTPSSRRLHFGRRW